eukprot:TRINITY_DN6932_c0_g1_i7.p1 TRINITY_DN6932_c0_g1~~TRINITY_DN6932_c0_g1_i7.p1  ORF type:complete len:538 (-),score=75.45 TRINITY_DN6932_c0_g1_i7:387-2000(-)
MEYSGYRQYIASASGAIMEMASSAATSVQTAASATYQNVTDSFQSHCASVAEKLMNYKYQDRSLLDTSPLFPDTLQPIYILGEKWSAKHDLEELKQIVQSRIWFTYRKDFPPIGSSECKSDQGWGCMLRCGQMLLASCLMDIHLSRSWRWTSESWDQPQYRNILKKFQDKKSAPYSIHQISLMGESVEKKPVGTWFGPNTVLQVLRKLTRMDPCNDLVIHVAMDNTLIVSEAKRASLIAGENGEEAKWRPLLLCVTLRLGLTEINPVYINGLKTCLSLPQTQGLLGGRPNHALYILGFVENEAIYLDPHVTQPYVELETWEGVSVLFRENEGQIIRNRAQRNERMSQDEEEVENDERRDDEGRSAGDEGVPAPHKVARTSDSPRFRRTDSTGADLEIVESESLPQDEEISEQMNPETELGQQVEDDLEKQVELVEREDMTFHASRPGRISIDLLDPSLSLAFLCKTEEDFDNLCIALQDKLMSVEKTPLFEMVLERPAHMIFPQSPCDISVQPDESTGSDYEQIERKYDSEEEFEII